MKERPSDPLVWTEDEGWFQTWAKDKKNPLPNDQRTAEDMAYAVARWFAVGGAAHNYYVRTIRFLVTMEFGGGLTCVTPMCRFRCIMEATILAEQHQQE